MSIFLSETCKYNMRHNMKPGMNQHIKIFRVLSWTIISQIKPPHQRNKLGRQKEPDVHSFIICYMTLQSHKAQCANKPASYRIGHVIEAFRSNEPILPGIQEPHLGWLKGNLMVSANIWPYNTSAHYHIIMTLTAIVTETTVFALSQSVIRQFNLIHVQ